MSKDKRFLNGYALRWNEPYLYENFIEVIDRRALDNADMSDVVALFNHDANQVLGRNTSRTLTLTPDEIGLRFRVEVPNTSLGEETAALVGRRDITTCSWGFTMLIDKNGNMPGETWTRTEKGTPIRTIKSVHKVYDVSITTWAANDKTSVILESAATRSDDREAMTREIEQAQMKMELTLARHKADKSKFEYEQMKRNTPLHPGVKKQLDFFKQRYNLK